MRHPVGCAVTAHHNQTIGRLSIEQWWQKLFYYVLNIVELIGSMDITMPRTMM
jgi:hypothetical protein